jgi:hypothetical protein
MATPSVEALNRQATEQSAEYRRLQQETRSLISAQNSMVRTLGLQKSAILGSIANVGFTVRENLKILQLKQQERKALESQLAAVKRKAELDRRTMELEARRYEEYRNLARQRAASGGALPRLQDEIRFRELNSRRNELRQNAARSAQQYETSSATERSIAGQVSVLPSKAALGFTAGVEILKSGINVASVAFGAFTSGLKAVTSALISFMNGIRQTQLEFGLTMSQAAKLQAETFITSAKDMMQVFKSVDLTGLGGIVTNVFSSLFSFGRNLTGIGFGEGSLSDATSTLLGQLKGVAGELTAERSFTAAQTAEARTYVSIKDRMESLKSLQNEFGTIDKEARERIASTATQRGVSVESLVRARRVFATQTLGDYNKIEGLQNRFVKVFEGKGMTIKTAMESIGKYSELMARNGTRFADSFAKAAAAAKLIGVDLGKVDQFGDNIIDNFEGFLESQAELGAMGFGFDSSRLAEIAITGDTGALQTELRSQLVGMGKDITKLNRAERLSLESATGMTISELQRLASNEPEITQEALTEESNSLLTNILQAMYPLQDLATFLNNPASLLLVGIASMTTTLGAIYQLLLKGLAGMGIGTFTAELEASKLFSENKPYMARDVLRQAGVDKSVMESMTEKWLTEDTQKKIKEGQMPNIRYSAETDKYVFYKPWAQRADGLGLPGTQVTTPSPYINPIMSPVKKAAGGIVRGAGTSTSDSIPARLSNGEYVVKASAVKAPGVKELLDKINYGTASVLMKAQGGFIGRLMGGMSSAQNMLSTYNTGGLQGLLGQFGNKIPGLSTAMNMFSAYKSGGVGGALKSAMSGGLGKMIGGALGSAIPIPGVGTMIGSLMGSKVGKLVGGLFGRKKKPVTQQIMSALPDMGGFAGNLMGRIPGMERFNPEGLFRGMAAQPQAQAAVQAVVDTTGIEQKLNNFINALNNMNIVMDGAKVGKVLVNVSDAASTVGVFRSETRATL